MSYPVTWSHAIASTEWIAVGNLFKCDVCPEHPLKECLRAVDRQLEIGLAEGTRRLRNPISLLNKMPGTGHKVSVFSFEALARICTYFNWATKLSLLGDGAVLVDVANPTHGINEWNKISLVSRSAPLDISDVSYLDLELYQMADVGIGDLELHHSNFYLEIEYLSNVAPQHGNLEVYVYDRQTNVPIPGVVCQVLRGNSLIKSVETNSLGIASFISLEEGGYMCNALGIPPSYIAGGYDRLSLAVEVVGNQTKQYPFGLNVLPQIELPVPWWVVGAGIGSVGLILGYTYLRGRKKESPPIVVVR